ncbi:MAG: hypothetical protein GY795_38895 [Desulfobacterales bacterium]|nr:hypothetical protein [Desulfobacterales bacterium]
MIRISRNRTDENGNPIKPDREWFETARKATTLAIAEQGNHIPEESVYRHPRLRTALEKLFHEKCAYCETKITAGSDWDVEHFRPKGSVAENSSHPGYYWLTYEWTNLYLSCPHCNQRRKDKPRWNDPTTAGVKGKGDQFPLESEETRAISHLNDINLEKPLLLDPCTDRPEDHLSFDVMGQISDVNDSRKGITSINVFHLARRRLHDARREIVNETVVFLKLIQKYEDEDNMEFAQQIKELLEQFLLADNCEYAATARAVVNDPDAFGL